MKIVIPGGSGQVGTVLATAFHHARHDVVVLSRRPSLRPWRMVPWDGETLGGWQREIDAADVVVNLAGRSVNCRYDRRNREEILSSRVRSTRVIGEAIAAAARPPRVWLQASTATIYAHRHDLPNDEATGRIGGDEPGVPETWRFSMDVARAWEGAFAAAVTPFTRKVAMRSAITLSPDPGGVFDVLLGLVRRGLGGAAGDGRQFMSWIHHRDFVSAVRWLIDHDDMAGVVNLASPNPVTNADFMRQLSEAANVRVALPAPEWLLALGAVVMRTETELILKSRRVIPARLLESGFTFAFPRWDDASRDLCAGWRARRESRTNLRLTLRLGGLARRK
jgi:uncharacterized protein (TIGR01777 family)